MTESLEVPPERRAEWRERFSIAEVHEASESHREHNEDRVLRIPEIGAFAIFDGAGGHIGGEQAADLAMEYVAKRLGEEFDSTPMSSSEIGSFLEALLFDAHQELLKKNADDAKKAETDPRYAGAGESMTTATIVIIKGNEAITAAIGDSPAYIYHENGILERITLDDGIFRNYRTEKEAREWEIQKALSNIVNPAELAGPLAAIYQTRNQVAKSLGISEKLRERNRLPEMRARIYINTLEDGDRVYIFSDGVTDPIEDPAIAEILQKDPDNEKALDALVKEAEKRNREGHPRKKKDDKSGVGFTYHALPEQLEKKPAPQEEKSAIKGGGAEAILTQLEKFKNMIEEEGGKELQRVGIGEYFDLTFQVKEEIESGKIGAKELPRLQAIVRVNKEITDILKTKLGTHFLLEPQYRDSIKSLGESMALIHRRIDELKKET